MATEKKPRAVKAKAPKAFTLTDALNWALKASIKKQDTPAFAHVFFEKGQVRCVNGEIAMGAACPLDGAAVVLADSVKAAIKAAAKQQITLVAEDGGLTVTAGAFKTTLEHVPGLLFPYEDPTGTEATLNCDPRPGLKSGLAFALDKAPDDKPYFADIVWDATGVISTSDGFVLHQGWAGGALYGSPITLSVPFTKILVKEKTLPTRWFCSGSAITAVWDDGRWLQGPSSNGAAFLRRMLETNHFATFDAATFVPVPDGVGTGATSLLATGATRLFYDGNGKLWTLPTEDGPHIAIDLGPSGFMVEGDVFSRISAEAAEWCLTKLPGVCYYRGTSCRGAFVIYDHTKVLPREEGQAEVGAGLADETEEV